VGDGNGNIHILQNLIAENVSTITGIIRTGMNKKNWVEFLEIVT